MQREMWRLFHVSVCLIAFNNMISNILLFLTHPMVVMVTKAHQNPWKAPWWNVRENCSGLWDES